MGRANLGARAAAGGKLASSRYPTQQLLIAAIRRGEESALRELFVLYAPLLRDQAKKMSVPLGEREQVVQTLLDDIAIHLAEVEIPPRELTSYIVSSLRNRIRTQHRDDTRAMEHNESAYGAYGDSSERIVAECHSQYGMQASVSSDAEVDAPLRSAIKKLADKSASELTREELTLMIGVGQYIPLRSLAEQLGLSHGAARVRLSRLRERFIKLAVQYLTTLEPREKREIERFFRRADVRLGPTTSDSNADPRDAGRKRGPQEHL